MSDSNKGLQPKLEAFVVLLRRRRDCWSGYSIFTSSAYRTHTVQWRFTQEIATLHDVAMSTSEAKRL